METKSQDLMISSGVKFGTSGARGLLDNMTYHDFYDPVKIEKVIRKLLFKED